jgi:hypothetical protein
MHLITRRTRRSLVLVVASAIGCAVAMPAAALADAWSYTSGPLEAAASTNAYLSVENDTQTMQTVNLGIFGGGDAGVAIAAGQTFTWRSNCPTAGGCLGSAVVQGSTPDLVPSFYYTPLGADQPTNVPAGGFAFSGPDGDLADYLNAGLSNNTQALASLETSAANEQTLLSTTQGQISGIVGSVQSVQSTLGGTDDQLGTVRSGLTTAIRSVSTEQQVAKLDSHVQALTKQVSALTALLTATSKKSSKPSRPKPHAG